MGRTSNPKPQDPSRKTPNLARRVGPPFGARFHSLVQGCGKDGDVATLLYLRWQIDRALAVAQGGAEGDGEDDDEMGSDEEPGETVN